MRSTMWIGVALLAAACLSVTNARGGKEELAASTHNVTISGHKFDPPTLTVAVGDSVTWTNNDSDDHTATANDGTFDGAVKGTGGTFTFTFKTAKSYPYHCTIHPKMTATIVVK